VQSYSDVISGKEARNFEKDYRKNDTLLNISEEFERMNIHDKRNPEKMKQLREQKAQKDLIQQAEVAREEAEYWKRRATAFGKLLEEQNDKIRLLRQGIFEELEEEIRKKDKEIKKLERKLAKEPHKNLRKKNNAVWNHIVNYLQNNQGKINNYRNVSAELEISLSTLHGIVKKLHEINKDILCPDCGVLPKPGVKKLFTGQKIKILVCSNCEKEVAKS
jgi:hypothetical protein